MKISLLVLTLLLSINAEASPICESTSELIKSIAEARDAGNSEAQVRKIINSEPGEMSSMMLPLVSTIYDTPEITPKEYKLLFLKQCSL